MASFILFRMSFWVIVALIFIWNYKLLPAKANAMPSPGFTDRFSKSDKEQRILEQTGIYNNGSDAWKNYMKTETSESKTSAKNCKSGTGMSNGFLGFVIVNSIFTLQSQSVSLIISTSASISYF